jgi:hypothetical protein
MPSHSQNESGYSLQLFAVSWIICITVTALAEYCIEKEGIFPAKSIWELATNDRSAEKRVSVSLFTHKNLTGRCKAL